MASFTDVTVSGILTASQIQGAVTPFGLIASAPGEQHAAFGAGAVNNVVLPGFKGDGPIWYRLTASADGAVLNGIETTDLSIGPGQLLILEIDGSHNIATAANAGGSTVGNRFTVATAMEAGTATLFIYNGTAFVPFALQAAP